MFNQMIQVAIFKFLPSEFYLSKIFPDLDEEVPYGEKFERLGFKTHYVIMNMGIMFFVLFIFLALLILLYLPIKMLARHCMPPRVLAYKLSSAVFFNGLIVFTQETYLSLLICIIINYHSFSGTKDRDNYINSAILLVMSLLVISLPVIILLYLCPNAQRLRF